MADESRFQSVITDEMRAKIGVEGEPQTHEVTTTGVRMFARAVGYDDPVYYDREVARAQGYRDLPAPPGFLGAPIFDPRESDPTFGVRRSSGPGVRSPYKLVLNGGTDVEYFDEGICAGDVLTARSKLDSLTERYSAALGGPMLIQVTATTYKNQDGKVVAVVRGTGISYGPKRDDT
ncbi:MAG: MaoC family dehydratase N-terminal domain-containing protein [Dehalococcoidia bacterium]